MKSMQERVLCRIEGMAAKAGLEPAQKTQFSNIGVIYLHKRGEMTPFASISYNFQDASYTLGIKWGGTQIPSQPGRHDYFDFYQAYDQPSRFWKAFANLLDQGEGSVA